MSDPEVVAAYEGLERALGGFLPTEGAPCRESVPALHAVVLANDVLVVATAGPAEMVCCTEVPVL